MDGQKSCIKSTFFIIHICHCPFSVVFHLRVADTSAARPALAYLAFHTLPALLNVCAIDMLTGFFSHPTPDKEQQQQQQQPNHTLYFLPTVVKPSLGQPHKPVNLISLTVTVYYPVPSVYPGAHHSTNTVTGASQLI